MKKGTCFLTAIVVLAAIFPSIAIGYEFEGRPIMRLLSAQTVEATVGGSTEVRIRAQNAGSGVAMNFFMQVSTPAGSPFSAAARHTVTGNDTVGVRGTREIPIVINVDPTAEPGTYPMTLNFVYTDFNGNVSESSQQMHVRIIGAAVVPNVSLSDFEMNPGSLRPGSTAVISATYSNTSASRARNVRVALSGLSNEGVTVVAGLDSVSINETGSSFSQQVSFTITAASNVRAGSYPITFITTYTDEWGNDHRNENVFFVNVSTGGLPLGDSAVNITNIRSAPGIYEVGQNFTVGFDLLNNGTGYASSIRVTARADEDSAVVPTSQNIQIIRTLAPDESVPVSFTFAATSNAATRNYPIGITIEYFDGEVNEPDAERISFSHYFGVNISNPDDDDDDQRNMPRIIISDYSSNPMIVTAGEMFDLNMTFFNTHSNRTISNIRITLTAQERDQERGANIFSPVNASNTLFVASIPPGGTVSRAIRFFTVPDAQPQNYTIAVNFEYEDDQGNPLSSTELIGINVSQPPRLETSRIEIPPMGTVGQPVFVDFELYNVGRVSINNLRVTVDGDFRIDGNASTWFGNFDQGDFERFSTIFFPNSPGMLTGIITIEYESATGDRYSIPHEFTMEIMDMPMVDFPDDGWGFDEREMEGGGGGNTWIFIAAGIAAVAVVGVAGVIFIIRKRKKEFEFDE